MSVRVVFFWVVVSEYVMDTYKGGGTGKWALPALVDSDILQKKDKNMHLVSTCPSHQEFCTSFLP
jgi:hypothetical protein